MTYHVDERTRDAIAAACRFIEIRTSGALGRLVRDELSAAVRVMGACAPNPEPRRSEWTVEREMRVRNAIRSAVEYIEGEHDCALGKLVVERLREALCAVPLAGTGGAA